MKLNVFILPALLLVTSTQPGCPKNIPHWDKKIWTGASSKGGFIRTQDNEFISCDDPKINDYRAIRSDSLDCLYETFIVNCKEFKKQSACGLIPE
jgi:hypothetical protein